MNLSESKRFTIDGSPELETSLASICQQVRQGVESIVPTSRLRGILLGGGYGRGEGGVFRAGTGDQPYNDLEFYVFCTGQAILAERRYRHALHELGEQLTPAAGLEVEFKVLTQRKLRKSPASMFYYDLMLGNRIIAGTESLLDGCEHHRHPEQIPAHEATRLLLNRCSGLLYSMERLRKTDFGTEEADFVGRNLAKAQLAFGDALLTVLGKYHWSCQERHKRLETLTLNAGLEWAVPLPGLHAEGVAFKLHPVPTPVDRDRLTARHTELCDVGRRLWLWLEGLRLGHSFASARDYALSPCDKCPETIGLRNRAVNARTFGTAAALGPGATRYPRQRLLHALPMLLWEPHTRENLAGAQAELKAPSTDFSTLVAAYTQLWHRFN